MLLPVDGMTSLQLLVIYRQLHVDWSTCTMNRWSSLYTRVARHLWTCLQETSRGSVMRLVLSLFIFYPSLREPHWCSILLVPACGSSRWVLRAIAQQGPKDVDQTYVFAFRDESYLRIRAIFQQLTQLGAQSYL